uniref:Uncharacterized protein n=1 Tax=Glossina pallidipes TaxID=7398 RepID=A0A1A9ZCV9_GLOPL
MGCYCLQTKQAASTCFHFKCFAARFVAVLNMHSGLQNVYKYMCYHSDRQVFVKSYCGIEIRVGDHEFSDMSIELRKVISICAIPLTMRPLTLTWDITFRKQRTDAYAYVGKSPHNINDQSKVPFLNHWHQGEVFCDQIHGLVVGATIY